MKKNIKKTICGLIASVFVASAVNGVYWGHKADDYKTSALSEKSQRGDFLREEQKLSQKCYELGWEVSALKILKNPSDKSLNWGLKVDMDRLNSNGYERAIDKSLEQATAELEINKDKLKVLQEAPEVKEFGRIYEEYLKRTFIPFYYFYELFSGAERK